MKLAEEQQLHLVGDAAALRSAPAQGPSIVVSAEGADFLDRSIERVNEAYAAYHLRHLQLTHYRVNDLGDIQTEAPVHGGLTDFGAEVIRTCNQLGIVVDTAHGTYDLVKRAAAVTTKPLVLSHTSVTRMPGPQSRQISPDHARAIAGTGGVIGVWPPSSIFIDFRAFVEGFARMADVVGVDHVGLGSDMMGLTTASVFDSYRDLPELAQGLLDHGFTPEETGKILGGNYARVFTATVA
jgi:membrane dipeptidase